MEQSSTVHKLLCQQIGKFRLYVPAEIGRGLLTEQGVCLIQDTFAAPVDAEKEQRKILVCGPEIFSPCNTDIFQDASLMILCIMKDFPFPVGMYVNGRIPGIPALPAGRAAVFSFSGLPKDDFPEVFSAPHMQD